MEIKENMNFSNKEVYLKPVLKTIIVKPEKNFLQEYEDSGTGNIDPVGPGEEGGGGTTFP